ncbi:MAG: alpha-L-glutamate ligase [Bacillati bacterium ANGP1]|uniref:Alpha-L-glutamate ligase n=1 Tax=Candidatus Segetimicrobium genomatis TaxID=2569760 RepID=A0A537K005_9BACT|nr:MAG: alpha-L-glutamate ligase [Terrabacteria group bacterium ANGP1]
MDICMILDNSETPQHPVIGPMLRQLSAAHSVRLLDVRTLAGDEAVAHEEARSLADLYLLKGHSLPALEVGHHLEQRGALVVNNWASSMACQDRVLMAERMKRARLPFPRIWSCPSLADVRTQRRLLSTLRFPLMVKSRYSRRGDLVDKVQDMEQVHRLAGRWGNEPVILQDVVHSDGWDIRGWVIDQQIFVARRRTPLEAGDPTQFLPVPAETIPGDWRSLMRETGRAFDLHLFSVDLLMTDQGPCIVDVDSFPGFRGAAGAVSALIALIERLGAERPGRPEGTGPGAVRRQRARANRGS